MHAASNKTSSMLLPPMPANNFTKAVPDLINFFEGLDTTIEEATVVTMSRVSAPFPSPFSALRLSLSTTFNHPNRVQTNQSSIDSTTTTSSSSTTTSASASPQSSLRGAAFARSRTWTSTRTRSRSPRSVHSHTNSPMLLSRVPSAVDLALLEEESLSHNVKGVGLGLELMEPRPVVPVAVAAGDIFEGSTAEGAEHRQPFVMGGIVEVMEGRS